MLTDQDLSPGEALLRALSRCSVDSGSNFHVLEAIIEMDIRYKHDELIAQIREFIPFMKGGIAHHRELAEQAIASLERKKRELESQKSDEAFIAALGNEGEGENRFHE